jgi:hypothetical protein
MAQDLLSKMLSEMLGEIRGWINSIDRARLRLTCAALRKDDSGEVLPPIWLCAYKKIKDMHVEYRRVWRELIKSGLDKHPLPYSIYIGSPRLDTRGTLEVRWMYMKNKGDDKWNDYTQERVCLCLREPPVMRKPVLQWAPEYDGPADEQYVPPGLLDLTDDRGEAIPCFAPFRDYKSPPYHLMTTFFWSVSECLGSPGFFFGDVGTSAWYAFDALPGHVRIGFPKPGWTMSATER